MNPTTQDVETRAQSLLKRGYYSQARELLRTPLRLEPNRGSLRLLRAMSHHAEGNWREALEDAETAMLLMPLPAAGTLVLGDAYAHSGRTELAMVAYEHLLAGGPHPADFYAGLYAGFRQCGRVDRAMETCRVACEADPDNHEARYGMAHCMSELGYAASFIAGVLKTVVEAAPDREIYRLSLALQLVRAASPSEAYEQLQQLPAESLGQIGCRCSARTLLELCAWAHDTQRTRILGDVLRCLPTANRLSNDKNEGENP
ncbi:Tetratricopeptide repeat protein [Pseudobythopirellula maris]|uniref:Tetratricopeptide repeat protein n=1 Tax=Pseudobythopirellula maris TaxID=2527991 RepID=A0A5C5ZTZ1_9BACT|nr:hypothetical protein [Pseudobythopirellula maris]TWT90537.1 Tetratricopeptide repeat protein [Pseudobythopirellula maris]